MFGSIGLAVVIVAVLVVVVVVVLVVGERVVKVLVAEIVAAVVAVILAAVLVVVVVVVVVLVIGAEEIGVEFVSFSIDCLFILRSFLLLFCKDCWQSFERQMGPMVLGIELVLNQMSCDCGLN